MEPVRVYLVAAAAVVLGCQAVTIQMVSKYTPEYLPDPPPLEQALPRDVADWTTVMDSPIDQEIADVLAADSLINRDYLNPRTGSRLNLFIAYYKSQNRGKGAHSPKVCLPSAGWAELNTQVKILSLDNTQIEANYYEIGRGNEHNLVLYWYQTPRRTFASEHVMKIHRIYDTFVSRRTDMAFVRVVVPVTGQNAPEMAGIATDFIKSIYPSLMNEFPPTRSTQRLPHMRGTDAERAANVLP